MKQKFILTAAVVGMLAMTACVDETESASVTDVRKAKAEQLRAKAKLDEATAQAELTAANAQAQAEAASAALAEAQAEKMRADAEYVRAQADYQRAQADLLAAQAEGVRIANELAKNMADEKLREAKLQNDILQAELEQALAKAEQDKAQAEKDKAYAEYLIAKYQADLEKLALELERDLLAIQQQIVANEFGADEYIAGKIQAAANAYKSALLDVMDKQQKLATEKKNLLLYENNLINDTTLYKGWIEDEEAKLAEKEALLAVYEKYLEDNLGEGYEEKVKELQNKLPIAFNEYYLASEAYNKANSALWDAKNALSNAQTEKDNAVYGAVRESAIYKYRNNGMSSLANYLNVPYQIYWYDILDDVYNNETQEWEKRGVQESMYITAQEMLEIEHRYSHYVEDKEASVESNTKALSYAQRLLGIARDAMPTQDMWDYAYWLTGYVEETDFSEDRPTVVDSLNTLIAKIAADNDSVAKYTKAYYEAVADNQAYANDWEVMNELYKDVDDAQAALDKATGELPALEADLATATGNLNTSAVTAAKSALNKAEYDVKDLDNKLATEQITKAQYDAQKTGVDNAYTAAKTAYDNAVAANKTLQDAVDAAKTKVDNKKAEIAEKKTAKDDADKALKDYTDAKGAANQAMNDAWDAKYEAEQILNSDKSKEEAVHNIYYHLLDQLNPRNSWNYYYYAVTAEEDLMNAKLEYETYILNWNQNLVTLSEMLEATEGEEYAELDAAIAEAEAAVADAEEAVEAAKEALAEARTAYNVINEQIRDIESFANTSGFTDLETYDWVGYVQSIKSRVNNLKNEIQNCNNNIETFNNKIENSESTYESNVDACKQRIAKIEVELEFAEKTLEAAKARYEALIAE